LKGVVRGHGVTIDATVDDAYDRADGFESIGDQLPGIGIVIGAVGDGDEIKTNFFHQLHKYAVVRPMASLTGQADKDVFGGGCAGIIFPPTIHKMIACSHLSAGTDKGEARAEKGAGDQREVSIGGELFSYEDSAGEICSGKLHGGHDAF